MRRALIRWLGGRVDPIAPEPQPAAPAPAAQAPLPGTAPPPIAPNQLLQQSERYFAYAELLCEQGSGDLAAPVYRQAYLGLRALVGISAVTAPAAQAALPPARSQAPLAAPPAAPPFRGGASAPYAAPAAPFPPAAAAPFAPPAAVGAPRPVAAPAAPPAAPPVAPAPSLEQQLQPLREGLSTTTAAEVERRLIALLQQGHRHEDLANLLGLALLLQDRRDEAERWFRETLTINPRHSRALVNLGGLCLTTQRPEEAVQLLSRAVELIDPRSSEILAALTNLCLAQQQLGRPMDAAQLALRIFRLKPDHLRPESLVAAAGTLEQMGDEQGAIELLSHLRGRGHADADLTRRLAQLLERRGDFQGAAMVYRDLLATPEAASAPS
jgi:tetratricopeptide (TPR) repeat protein